MKKSFKKSDLDILLKIFIPGKYILFINNTENALVNDGTLFAGASEKSKDTFLVLANFSVAPSKDITYNRYDFIIDFAGLTNQDMNRKDFRFICNSDKTMRWIFPSDSRRPSFLNFYHASGLKARLMTVAMKTVYSLGFGKLLSSGGFSLYYNYPLKVETNIEKIKHDNYSIFTGTVGPNRKLLVELNTKGVSTHFAKWAISESSEKLILNEYLCNQELKKLNLVYSVVPEAMSINDPAFVVYKNVRPAKYSKSSALSDIHLKALAEIYKKTIVTYNLSAVSGFRQQTLDTIYSLSPDKRIPGSERVIKLLRQLSGVLNSNDNVPFATAHFDFTPWNMFRDSEVLYVYDWELSNRKAPLLFDLFHYVFQKCILTDHTDLYIIKKEIGAALAHPIIKEVIARYNVDVELCYKAYLLYNISYYLKIYSEQNDLHKQVFWLVKVWQNALEEITAIKSEVSQRKNFINQLTAHLNQFDYALMKFSEKKISRLEDSSDLDVLIRKENLNQVLRYIKGTSGIQKIREVKKSFMTTVSLFFEDGSFLSIDLIYNFKRKAQTLFSASKILNHTEATSEGVKVPQRHHDFEYMFLFYQLNRSDVPVKYLHYFESFSHGEQRAICDYMKSVYGLTNAGKENLFFFSEELRNELKRVVDLRKENRGVMKISSTLRYWKDTIIELVGNRGVIITVSGVDGAGKSTIIEDIKNTLINKFRKKVVVLRHRPSLLPILSAWKYGKKEAEAMAASRLPRQGKNKSNLSSVLRFSYYYSDYIIGQVYVNFKYVLRGYTVIYDRYYFDFIGDAQRSNLKMNKNFVTWLYTFIYKPSLNVLLYAPAEVIMKRKQELKEEDIKELTKDYLSLFNKLSSGNKNSKYMAIENMDRKETLDSIVKEYVKVVV